MDQPEPKNFWTVTALKTLNSGLQQVADYDIDNIFQATLNTELQGFLVELNNLFL